LSLYKRANGFLVKKIILEPVTYGHKYSKSKKRGNQVICEDQKV
jgi:hypothetical protein